MRMRNTLSTVLVLSALVTASCTSLKIGKRSTAVDKLRLEITKQVTDATRQGEMLQAVDRMVAAIEELQSVTAGQEIALNRQIQNYATPREAVDVAMTRDLMHRQAIIGKLAKAHFDLKKRATEAEWKKLVKKEKKALAWAVENSTEGGA